MRQVRRIEQMAVVDISSVTRGILSCMPNTKAAIDFEILLAYLDEESARWETFLGEHPDALKVRIDIAQAEDVGGLIFHTFAVEFRFAERLDNRPDTPLDQLPKDPASVFRMGRESRERLRRLAATSADMLHQKVTFKSSVLGDVSMSFRKCLTHAIIHSVRHWAQLATELRKAGYAQDWQHDFLLTKVME